MAVGLRCRRGGRSEDSKRSRGNSRGIRAVDRYGLDHDRPGGEIERRGIRRSASARRASVQGVIDQCPGSRVRDRDGIGSQSRPAARGYDRSRDGSGRSGSGRAPEQQAENQESENQLFHGSLRK